MCVPNKKKYLGTVSDLIIMLNNTDVCSDVFEGAMRRCAVLGFDCIFVSVALYDF